MRNRNRNNGPIIVVNKDTGDCEKFLSMTELLTTLKIRDNNFRNIEKVKEHPEFKKRYIFFAMERDILSW